jgi:hypothetical protein
MLAEAETYAGSQQARSLLALGSDGNHDDTFVQFQDFCVFILFAGPPY